MNTEPQLQPSQRNRLQIVPLAIWSGAVFIVIAATILFANDQKNFRLLKEIVLSPPSPVSPGPPAGTSAQSPETVQKRQALLEMPATETIPLVRLASTESRCKSLTLTNQELPVYTETDRFSQCMVLYRDGVGQASPSVFIQIQTDQTGMVSSFRLKFNTEGKAAETLVPKGLKFLELFGGFFLRTEEFLAGLSSRIESWENFRMVLGPYVVEMNQEIIDPTRFNVLGRLHHARISKQDVWREQQGSILPDPHSPNQ